MKQLFPASLAPLSLRPTSQLVDQGSEGKTELNNFYFSRFLSVFLSFSPRPLLLLQHQLLPTNAIETVVVVVVVGSTRQNLYRGCMYLCMCQCMCLFASISRAHEPINFSARSNFCTQRFTSASSFNFLLFVSSNLARRAANFSSNSWISALLAFKRSNVSFSVFSAAVNLAFFGATTCKKK